MGQAYKGFSVAIVTAADEPFARLLLDLCASLGPWRQNLRVIDIGLGAATRDELARMNVKIQPAAEELFAGARLLNNYVKALYLRPRLPDLVAADIIMWIDSDCWLQRQDGITAYLDSAIEFPDKFTLCAMLDVDYARCIDDYWSYQERYREQYAALFGTQEAERLLGKAVLSAGVFAARRTAPAWAAWRATVSQVYRSDAAFTRSDLAHMGEQLSLNLVLHRERAYRILNAEMNWHCHCSDVVRDNGRVRILPSGRVPAIVHLSDIKTPAVVGRYRDNRLFYERTGESLPATSSAGTNAPEKSEGSIPSRICVYTCLMGESEKLNEQPAATASRLPFICFTDNPNLRSDTWDVRVVPRLFAADPIRSQRAVKALPFDHLGAFDASLYIDNTVLLKQPPDAFVEANFPQSGFCLSQHSYRATVFDEFTEVAAIGLDDQSRIAEQLEHYRLSYPDVLQEKPYWGAILLRDHRVTAVRKMLEIWFAHVQRYSRRDQLSVNLAFRLAGLTPKVLCLDNFESDYHVWPRRTLNPNAPAASRGSLRAGALDDPVAAELLRERQKTADLLATTARLDRALAESQHELAQTRHSRDALLGSKSWRVTAPLRKLARGLGRLAGQRYD